MLPTHPVHAVETLLGELAKRSSSVLEKRFGLGKGGKRYTLEAIGKTYHITRERVRQIERDGLMRIKKTASYNKTLGLFDALNKYIGEQGGVVAESAIVKAFADQGAEANYIRFLLTIAPGLHYRGEDDHFNDRWALGKEMLDSAETGIMKTSKYIQSEGKLVTREEMLGLLARTMQTTASSAPSGAALASYLDISKNLDSNCFGQWGHAESALVKPRGVRDMAYLVFKKEERPLHFIEAASLISNLITKKQVHAQTVHNELIKDDRFVLVGRGTYGLAEWGYEPGTVRDIISRTLKHAGPLSKDEVVTEVLGKRQVKANTILINLQNKRYFKKLADGRYTALV